MYVCMCVYIYTYVYVCIYVSMYVCMYVCMYVPLSSSSKLSPVKYSLGPKSSRSIPTALQQSWIMLRYVLYYTMLCYTTLDYAILNYTIIYYTILYYTIRYDTIRYYITVRCSLTRRRQKCCGAKAASRPEEKNGSKDTLYC